jgi:hypothetical protein
MNHLTTRNLALPAVMVGCLALQTLTIAETAGFTATLSCADGVRLKDDNACGPINQSNN